MAPIQLLTNLADTYLLRIYRGWKRRNVAGNRPIVNLEGINSVTAERLDEEGIDYIQQMAWCDPGEIALKTKFPLNLEN